MRPDDGGRHQLNPGGVNHRRHRTNEHYCTVAAFLYSEKRQLDVAKPLYIPYDTRPIQVQRNKI